MIRVFPRKTSMTPDDALAFVGDPPKVLPTEQPVRVSGTFTEDITEAVRLVNEWSKLYGDVQAGGPAFGDEGGDFVSGQFLREGVTITSRGCPRNCPWCFVPLREGGIRELPIVPGHIVQDNNLLSCSQKHIEAVFDMLCGQKQAAIFAGGLDARLFTERHRRLMDSIRVKELWFACDTAGGNKPLLRVAKILDGISINKRRCYVLVGFDTSETLQEADRRCEQVYEMGYLPFAMLHANNSRDHRWRRLQRFWSRPAIYRARVRQPKVFLGEAGGA